MAETLSIEGLSVGHFSDHGVGTGCTVVLAPDGVTGSVDIRGGGPGTLETALLSPYASVGEIHGIMLTGGSAPGLGAAAGVTRYLSERGLGYRTPYARVPLVAGAVIYDLGFGNPEGCPFPDNAYEAAATAGSLVEEGSIGAGTGATVGKMLGPDAMMKGGIGFASIVVAGNIVVSALTVVNALGDIMDGSGNIMAGTRRDGGFADSQRLLVESPSAPDFNAIESTTLSVVMTDAKLDKLQCGIVARMSHDGFARAIRPVHTPVDGDCVFVLATGRKPSNVFQIGAAAAEVVAESVRHGVIKAQGCAQAPSIADLRQGRPYVRD
jgi:L-aminopeptidase/D-esterase-like protein